MEHCRLIKSRSIKALLAVAAVVAAMVCLCACGGSNDNKAKQKLDTPQNLCIQTTSDIADGIWFVWDDVSQSDYYTVDINGEQYRTTDAYVNLKEVEALADSVAVKVMAKCSNSDYTNSDWSQECKVTIFGYELGLLPDGRGYEVLNGTNIEGNVLIWPSYEGKPIVKIGNSAFKDNAAITGIILPDSIEEIGNNAFANNTSLTEITLPDGLKKIGQFAFKGCSGLTSVHIPCQVEKVGNNIIRECENLVELTVDDGNNYYRSEGNCIIKKSNNQVVAGCAGSVIPADAATIKSDAFSCVYGLKSITIPSNIKEISHGTFLKCKDLEEVVISAGTQSIYASAFEYCNNLKRITVEDGNPVYRSENNCVIQGSTLVWGCAGSVIPSDVTVIGEYAFTHVCHENLIIPSSVVKIENCAFEFVTLDDIVIPSSVQTIGEFAFYESRVKSVVIENGVKSIGKYAFAQCPGLERLYVPTSVTSIGMLAFFPYVDPMSGTGMGVVAKVTCAPTVFSENVNKGNGETVTYSSDAYGEDADTDNNDVSITETSAYYHSENSELEVENNYPYVVSYYIPKTITSGLWGISKHENSAVKCIFDAFGKYKAFAPYRMGYTFGGWAVERDGTEAITSENTIDDLETFTVDGDEYVRVYAIWHKD